MDFLTPVGKPRWCDNGIRGGFRCFGGSVSASTRSLGTYPSLISDTIYPSPPHSIPVTISLQLQSVPSFSTPLVDQILPASPQSPLPHTNSLNGDHNDSKNGQSLLERHCCHCSRWHYWSCGHHHHHRPHLGPAQANETGTACWNHGTVRKEESGPCRRGERQC